MGARVERHERWLRLQVDDEVADFHHLWLRHNVDEDRHPVTRERIVDSSELDEDVAAFDAVVDGDALDVSFSDGKSSRFSIAWLLQHAYARGRIDVPPPPSRVSDHELLRGAGNLDLLVAAVLPRLRRQGAVVVRAGADVDAERETEALVDAFADAGLDIVSTHFGRIEDLRPDNTTNANTDQLGYTDAGIDVHTDQPFIARPPRYQILQAIVAAEEGGDSFVVDARAAARYLRATDADAWRLLTTVPVRFHRKQKSFESVVDAPILDVASEHGFQVRFSYFTMAPHQLSFAEMESWYRAYNRFARLVRDPRHQLRFKLGAGDFVVYDNHRMLHGRTAFRGRRWLRGIYLNER